MLCMPGHRRRCCRCGTPSDTTSAAKHPRCLQGVESGFMLCERPVLRLKQGPAALILVSHPSKGTGERQRTTEAHPADKRIKTVLLTQRLHPARSLLAVLSVPHTCCDCLRCNKQSKQHQSNCKLHNVLTRVCISGGSPFPLNWRPTFCC